MKRTLEATLRLSQAADLQTHGRQARKAGRRGASLATAGASLIAAPPVVAPPAPPPSELPAPDGESLGGRLVRYAGVAVTAVTGAVLNVAPFKPFIDLPDPLVALVVMGFETIVVLGCGVLGGLAGRGGGQARFARLTMVAIAVTVVALAGLRAHLLVKDGYPVWLMVPAAAFFAAIGCLLCALSYDLGRMTAIEAAQRRARRQGRRVERAASGQSRAGRAQRRIETAAAALRLTWEAWAGLANACLDSYRNGYRTAVPADLRAEIDDEVKVPEVSFP